MYIIYILAGTPALGRVFVCVSPRRRAGRGKEEVRGRACAPCVHSWGVGRGVCPPGRMESKSSRKERGQKTTKGGETALTNTKR